MHQLQYVLRTVSPVLLTSISGDTNMVSTLDYIPGSVVRGAFAKKYIEKRNLGAKAHEEDFFYDCFLNSGLSFTNAYIIKEGINDTIHYPTPLSIMSTKTKESKILDLIKSVPDEQTKYLGKYCEINGNNIDLLIPSKSINLHNTRKNRLKGCSDDGAIYNYESIDPLQEFSGRLIGTKDVLEKLIKLFDQDERITIGRSKSIQYGQAKIRWVSGIQEFDSEINPFNKELTCNFTVTFLSPAVIYNNNGFSTAALSDFRSYLADGIGVQRESITINKTFKKSESVENFLSIWLLKTPSETCIKAGTCFDITIKDWSEKTKELLIEFQKNGIGERTGEGFGRFVLNLQESEHYTLQKEAKDEVKKPPDEIPEITKELIRNVAIKSFYALAEARALKDYRGFCENGELIPTNSLLGKLELMLKNSSNIGEFINTINSLPTLSKDKLERCRNQEITLFNFIKKEGHILEIINQGSSLQECCSLINFKPDTDEDLKFKTFNHYWITFFRNMRKEKKKGWGLI